MIAFHPELCTGCAGCVPICPVNSLSIDRGRLTISENCIDCGKCVDLCPYGALGEKYLSIDKKFSIPDYFDVIVIGGGPAGSISAKILASAGAKTLLIEKKNIVGIPQLCAEGVSHSGLSDVLPKIKDTWISAPITGAILVSPKGKKIVVHHPKAGYILERRVFDRDLFADATNAGAISLTSTKAVNLIWEKDCIVGVEIEREGIRKNVFSKIIIAADGIESNVARWLFPNEPLEPKDIHVAAQAVMAGVDVRVGYPEFHVGRRLAPGGYAWVFPKGNGTANVGLGLNPTLDNYKKRSAWERLKSFIKIRFDGAGQIIELAGGNVPTARRLTRIGYRNVMLIGDAGRLSDPISGGGIATALLSGKLSAELAITALEAKSKEGLETIIGGFSSIWDRRKGRQFALYCNAKRVFSRLNDSELEEICSFIDEKFGNRTFESIDIYGAIKSILKRQSLAWGILKAFFKRG